MHANQPDAPELARNPGLVMCFPCGQDHFAVRAGSDIQVLDDIEGASVFPGRQGACAYNGARGYIEATTGLDVGEDREAVMADWRTGYQAFPDGKAVLYVNGCIVSCEQVILFAETEELRSIGPEDDSGGAVDKWLGQFRYRGLNEPGQNQGQANTEAVKAWNESAAGAVRGDLDVGSSTRPPGRSGTIPARSRPMHPGQRCLMSSPRRRKEG